ncbi:uncharacterized protein LOC119162963 isoform X1 [Rhipicephalus microplus]|uniref:uncharacterized protein LOC119162963 isoform X1 n=1 Tax=Rhipicephalus microplus TaxID=6941 RepID=UPI003F6BADC1
MRMPPRTFGTLLELLRPPIYKQDTNHRPTISAHDCLAMTIRWRRNARSEKEGPGLGRDRKHVRHVEVLCNMSAIDQSSHITAEEANEKSPPRRSHAAEPERTPDMAEETGVDTCSNE